MTLTSGEMTWSWRHNERVARARGNFDAAVAYQERVRWLELGHAWLPPEQGDPWATTSQPSKGAL